MQSHSPVSVQKLKISSEDLKQYNNSILFGIAAMVAAALSAPGTTASFLIPGMQGLSVFFFLSSVYALTLALTGRKQKAKVALYAFTPGQARIIRTSALSVVAVILAAGAAEAISISEWLAARETVKAFMLKGHGKIKYQESNMVRHHLRRAAALSMGNNARIRYLTGWAMNHGQLVFAQELVESNLATVSNARVTRPFPWLLALRN